MSELLRIVRGRGIVEVSTGHPLGVDDLAITLRARGGDGRTHLLDRPHVEQLHAALGAWLTSTEEPPAVEPELPGQVTIDDLLDVQPELQRQAHAATETPLSCTPGAA